VGKNIKNSDFLTPMPCWREYQDNLKKAGQKNRVLMSIIKLVTAGVAICFLAYGIISGLTRSDLDNAEAHYNNPFQAAVKAANHKTSDDPNGSLRKEEIQSLLNGSDLINIQDKTINIISRDVELRLETSIDIALQQFILKKIKRSTSRYIGIVTMDPLTGRILTIVGYDKTDPGGNPCLSNIFPAASIFKIVTASAAIEKCGFSAQSGFKYNGRKHTLYKSQLKERTNKYTNRVTLKDSFAQSVNPVFGKLGALYLRKQALEQYANAFGFNNKIGFEIKLSESIMHLSDDPYEWAEIASGFNRETRMSPIHGALIAAAIVNKGKLLEPTIVDRIVDLKDQTLYRSQVTLIRQAIKPSTSKTITDLMMATIKSGTCRKSFRGYKRDRVLSKLNIGGKTGSINNKTNETRYDWFTGFAEEKTGPGKIAISIVVAHEKYLGTRASQYARMIMKKFFQEYFSKNRLPPGKAVVKGATTQASSLKTKS
jgi:cell division protein FtsI/penicillin-binding protein 2